MEVKSFSLLKIVKNSPYVNLFFRNEFPIKKTNHLSYRTNKPSKKKSPDESPPKPDIYNKSFPKLQRPGQTLIVWESEL